MTLESSLGDRLLSPDDSGAGDRALGLSSSDDASGSSIEIPIATDLNPMRIRLGIHSVTVVAELIVLLIR